MCGAKMLHRQLRALIAASLLSKTVASTTYLHTPFSAPKTYMCICASLWLKNKPLSSQTRPTYACTCVHILICTCIRLLTATVLDKCLHVCRAARLQDKMHSIISQSVRVQYSSDTYCDIWFVCVCECACVIWFRREKKKKIEPFAYKTVYKCQCVCAYVHVI